MVETAKRILTKEKVDKKVPGQSSSTPYMSGKDSYDNKRVTNDIQEGLEDKVDRLTVMKSKLATNEEGTNKQFKPKIYQSKSRGQMRNFYDRHNYQNRYRSNIIDRRLQCSGRIQYGQNYRGRLRYGQSFENDNGRRNFRGNARMYQRQNLRGQSNRGGHRGNFGNQNYERGRSRSRERAYSDTLEGMTGVVVIVCHGQDQE